MALLAKKHEPTQMELRLFGVLVAAFCGVLGALVLYHTASWKSAAFIWASGVIGASIYYAVRSVQYMAFRAWTAVFFPVGWLVSHAMLATVYYGVLTPIGVLLNFWRHDALLREYDTSAKTYWVASPPPQHTGRYFRQF